MKLPDVMQSPRLKVKRAYSHIDTLVRDTTVLPQHLYEITNGPARSHAALMQPDCFQFAYRPKEPINEHYGAIMGDAVNNLREALDYWMNNAIRCVGPAKKVHFPFSAERKDLEASRNYPPIQKAFPDAATFISTDIQPCRDTNLHLWAATSLCNDNKHNDFLPVVTLGNLNNFNIRIGNSGIGGGGTVAWHADKPMVFAQSRNGPIAIDEEFGLAAKIAFPKGAVFEDQPVIPTLTNMAEVVSQTLDALEVFIRPHCR